MTSKERRSVGTSAVPRGRPDETRPTRLATAHCARPPASAVECREHEGSFVDQFACEGADPSQAVGQPITSGCVHVTSPARSLGRVVPASCRSGHETGQDIARARRRQADRAVALDPAPVVGHRDGPVHGCDRAEPLGEIVRDLEVRYVESGAAGQIFGLRPVGRQDGPPTQRATTPLIEVPEAEQAEPRRARPWCRRSGGRRLRPATRSRSRGLPAPGRTARRPRSTPVAEHVDHAGRLDGAARLLRERFDQRLGTAIASAADTDVTVASCRRPAPMRRAASPPSSTAPGVRIEPPTTRTVPCDSLSPDGSSGSGHEPRNASVISIGAPSAGLSTSEHAAQPVRRGRR